MRRTDSVACRAATQQRGGKKANQQSRLAHGARNNGPPVRDHRLALSPKPSNGSHLRAP